MNFGRYVKDKINYILSFIVYGLIIIFFLYAMEISKDIIIIVISISFIFDFTGFIISFYNKNKTFKNINNIIDKLDEKYLISEIINKPKREEKLAYYNILKKANKSMIENVTDIKNHQKEYKEYIESWVHEIKIPITSAKLLCENNKNDITNKIDEEVEEINNYVEQVLFYARLEQVSNDFMIKEINLQNVVKNVILRNKKIMIQNNMKVDIENINCICYSDEKWLEFILNQIIINSIKYKKLNNSTIWISVEQNKDNVKLKIRDNGLGIKKSELGRIFDKGFTGSNGRNQKTSTGIGLYLCKRLCTELGMEIFADSNEGEYTEIVILIPRVLSYKILR